MRIHVTFIDRVGITQEVLALLGGRNLNLDAVEMVPPNVYIDAPTLGAEVLEELREAFFGVQRRASGDDGRHPSRAAPTLATRCLARGQHRPGVGGGRARPCAAGQPGTDCPVRSGTGR